MLVGHVRFRCLRLRFPQKTKRLRPFPGSEPFACIEVQHSAFPAQKSTDTKPHRKSNWFWGASPLRHCPHRMHSRHRLAPAPYRLRRTAHQLFPFTGEEVPAPSGRVPHPWVLRVRFFSCGMPCRTKAVRQPKFLPRCLLTFDFRLSTFDFRLCSLW